MSQKSGEYVKCETCGKSIYKNLASLKKSVHFYCSRECSKEGQSLLFIEKLKEKVCCEDFGVWLREQYIVKKRSTTSIRNELGIWNHAIVKLLKRYSIDTRSFSEAVTLDWKDNIDKRKLVSENAKRNIGKDSTGRIKLKKIMQSEEYRIKISKANSGTNNGMYGRLASLNPSYNDKLTIADRISRRNLMGYTRWREEVYKRDNYACVCCGDNKGGNKCSSFKVV